MVNAETLRLNPTQAIYVQLDDIGLSLQDILQELRRRPSGHIMSLSGTLSQDAIIEQRLAPSWWSFVLTNDGPDSLEFTVNDRNTPFTRVLPRETVPVNFSGTLIDTVYLRSLSGQVSNYRIFGVY